MPFSLILDICVAILLMVTIGFAMTLNKRLTRLRNDKKDLEVLARTFGEATKRAEDNINQLKVIAQALDIQMGRAQTLRDDMTFLVERGGSAADRLEDLVREARDGLGAVPQAARPSMSSGKVGIETRDDEQARRSAGPDLSRRAAAPDTPRRGLTAEPDGFEARSEAERELLRALRDVG